MKIVKHMHTETKAWLSEEEVAAIETTMNIFEEIGETVGQCGVWVYENVANTADVEKMKNGKFKYSFASAEIDDFGDTLVIAK